MYVGNFGKFYVLYDIDFEIENVWSGKYFKIFYYSIRNKIENFWIFINLIFCMIIFLFFLSVIYGLFLCLNDIKLIK